MTTHAAYTLTDFVENLALLTGGVDGTGNELNNTLTGNTVANALSGEGGNDLLIGGAGYDLLTGGADVDRFDFDVVSHISADGNLIDIRFDRRGQTHADVTIPVSLMFDLPTRCRSASSSRSLLRRRKRPSNEDFELPRCG